MNRVYSKTNIRLYKALLCMAVLLFLFAAACAAAGCRGGDSLDTPAEIIIDQTPVIIDGGPMPLPALYIKTASGAVSQRPYTDFWFQSGSVYVQNDLIYEKSSINGAYDELMEITLKSDPAVNTTLNVQRKFVLLKSVSLRLKKSIIPGGILAIYPSFSPSNASYKKIESTIGDYQFAHIENGFLYVDEDAPPGDIITLKITVDAQDARQPKVSFEQTLTVKDYVEISTAQQFAALQKDCSEDYKLTNDIDLSQYENWQPVRYFLSCFDGNGFTIKNINLYVPEVDSKTPNTYGLFADNYGTIKNLTVENIVITCAKQTSTKQRWIYIGGLVGYNRGKITRVTVINAAIETNGTYVDTGAVAGVSTLWSTAEGEDIEKLSVLSFCTVTGAQITTDSQAGGVAGGTYKAQLTDCKVQDSYISYSLIKANNNIGGIAGLMNKSTATGCSFNNSAIELVEVVGIPQSSVNPSIGNIAGYMSDSILENSKVNGSIINLNNLLTRNQRRYVSDSTGFYGNAGGAFEVR